MDVEQQQQNELSQWFSTYGLITADRILGRYQIHLSQDMLGAAVKNPNSFYHHLLQMPLKNVLNGIVQQQAYDYNVYAQKLFVDYLLSNDSADTESGPGGATRETLEEERKQLLELGEKFHELEIEHGNFIASTQSILIKITQKWIAALDKLVKELQNMLKQTGQNLSVSEVKNVLNRALCSASFVDSATGGLHSEFINQLAAHLKGAKLAESKPELERLLSELVAISKDYDTSLSDYFEQTKQLHEQSKYFRNQFYETILRVLESIRLLPEYKIDPIQDQANRESLHFDKTIGEES